MVGTDNVDQSPQNSIASSGMISLLHMFNILVDWTFYGGQKALKATKEHNTAIIPPGSPRKRDGYGGPINEEAETLLGEQFPTYEGKVRGLQAETAVFQQFQRCDHQIKGILLQNFSFCNSAKAYEKAIREGYVYMTSEREVASGEIIKALKSMPGEADFIFLHPSIGICLVEVKGIKSKDNPEQKHQKIKSVHEACQQLKQIEKNLKDLYTHVICSTNATEFPPIYKIVSLPFMSSTSLNNISVDDNYIMGAEMLNREGKQGFVEFFTNKAQGSVTNENEFIKFCALLVALKCEFRFDSQWIEYTKKEVKQRLFVFQRHSMLGEFHKKNVGSSNILLPKKSPYFFHSDNDVKECFVWLTHEQILAADSNRSKCILFGPPGSGKTIVLMTRILEAAKSAKKIWIGCPRPLVSWYQYFVVINSISSAEVFDFKDLLGRLSQISPENSTEINIYFDEMDLETLADYYQILINRPKEVDTFIVDISPPKEKQNLKNVLKYLPDYTVCQMKKILRNTVTIMIYVKKLMKCPHDILLGHSVDGNAIREIECHSRKEMTQMLVQRVRTLIANGFSKSDIAIFDLHRKNVHCFKECLIQEDITLKECQDSVADDAVTFIPCAEESRSREWPAVILLVSSDLEKIPDAPLAASRAMLDLTIITDIAFRDAVNAIVNDKENKYPVSVDWRNMLLHSCYTLKGLVPNEDGNFKNHDHLQTELVKFGYFIFDFDIADCIRSNNKHLRNNEGIMKKIWRQWFRSSGANPQNLTSNFDHDSSRGSDGSQPVSSKRNLPISSIEDLRPTFSGSRIQQTLNNVSNGRSPTDITAVFTTSKQHGMSKSSRPSAAFMDPSESSYCEVEPSPCPTPKSTAYFANNEVDETATIFYAQIPLPEYQYKPSERTLLPQDKENNNTVLLKKRDQSKTTNNIANNFVFHGSTTQTDRTDIYRILQDAFRAMVTQKQRIPEEDPNDKNRRKRSWTQTLPLSIPLLPQSPVDIKQQCFEKFLSASKYLKCAADIFNYEGMVCSLARKIFVHDYFCPIAEIASEFGASEKAASQFAPEKSDIEKEIISYAGKLLFCVEGFDRGHYRTIKSLSLTVNHNKKWTAKAKLSQATKTFTWISPTSQEFDSCPSQSFTIKAVFKTANGSVQYSANYNFLDLLKSEPTATKLNFERPAVKLGLYTSVTWIPGRKMDFKFNVDRYLEKTGLMLMNNELFDDTILTRSSRRGEQHSEVTSYERDSLGYKIFNP